MADLTFFEFVFKEFSYFPVTLSLPKPQSEDIFAMLCRLVINTWFSAGRVHWFSVTRVRQQPFEVVVMLHETIRNDNF